MLTARSAPRSCPHSCSTILPAAFHRNQRTNPMPQSIRSPLGIDSGLNHNDPSVRKDIVQHAAIPASTILQHLTIETNEAVIISCLLSLRHLSDRQALEALGVNQSHEFSPEFYAVLRDAAEHYSPSVRIASATPISKLLNSAAAEQAFAILEHLLCDLPKVSCAAIDAMLSVKHPYKLSKAVVRALISLCDAGEKSALYLVRDIPCKTISAYAFLQFWMERKVYNATNDNRRELDELFSSIVRRNENFARVLDFPKHLHDKQWLWRGESHDT